MNTTEHYIDLLKKGMAKNFRQGLREPGEPLEYPFIVPGSDSYNFSLWDWDSWLFNIALRQIAISAGDAESLQAILPYERGCILNFLKHCDSDGWIPLVISVGDNVKKNKPAQPYKENMHKPVLAQHAAFLTMQSNGDAEWLRELMPKLFAFVNNYINHRRHANGLYCWQTDCGIGVDNDPCTYFRPANSSGSIFLNCLMYKELLAVEYLCMKLSLDEVAEYYRKEAKNLRDSINRNCWDERDGFYYSVDLNIHSQSHIETLHVGMKPNWDCLIQRIGVWSGFLGLWAELATPEMAERIVLEHYANPKTFNATYGVRTLSKMEKMYQVLATGNPSCWLGPIWGIANYLTFRGLVKYGFNDHARELACKTIELFGRDWERFGTLHECYQCDNGQPIMNRGFLNWNCLVLNMAAWLKGETVVCEF